MQIAVPGALPYNADKMATTKTKVKSETFRLTATASLLLAACAEAKGISKAAIIEQVIRDYAKREKITLSKPPAEGES